MRRSYKYAVVWFVEHGSNNNNYLGLTWGERGNETVVINGANRSIGNWKSKPTINRFDGNNSAFCLLVSKTKFIWIRHSLRHPNRIVNRNLTPPAAIASRSTLQLIIIMNHDDIIVKEFFYSPGLYQVMWIVNRSLLGPWEPKTDLTNWKIIRVSFHALRFCFRSSSNCMLTISKGVNNLIEYQNGSELQFN